MTEEKRILNKEQKEAVEYKNGPLLIIAGAGTGKTTVITERIKYLIVHKGVKPSQILALTFTDKAAREMEERVDLALPYGYTEMWILTFHSFCDRVLRQEAVQVGLDPAYRLLSQAETVQFLTKNLFKLDLEYFRPLGNPTKFVEGLINHFSRLKDEDVSPNEYLLWAKSLKSKVKSQKDVGENKIEIKKYLELARAYQQYEELKAKEGVMDFGDLISNTLRLFRNRKNILSQYRQRFKQILVDEFQDTNYSQNQLAMLLAGKKANLTVCADDDQSIYRFRGAAVSNVIQFRKNYPKGKIVVLTKNYRSTQEILDRSYQLIQENNPDRLEVKEGIEKKLIAIRKIEGEPIELIWADRVENESERVAKKIKELVAGEKYEWKDFAILIRANSQAEAFARAFSRLGVPYQFLGPGQLFRREEVKDLIAYLKLLYNFDDNVALFRVLSMDQFGISARDLAGIGNFARRFNLSLFESCEQVEKIFVLPETKEKIKVFVKMVERHLKLIAKETAGQILYYFLEDSGLLKKLTSYKTIEEETRVQNIAKFFDRLKSYESDHEDASVTAVVDWINLSLNLGESPLASNFDWGQEDRVNILTVHSSKGLEFKVVFLVNLVAGRFPSREWAETIPLPEEIIKEVLPEGDYHLEEERRLFYVGMTRAKDRLFLTAAKYYNEGKRERKISAFVYEALGKKEVEKELGRGKEEEMVQQLSILDWQKPADQLVAVIKRSPITYLSFSQIETFQTCPLQYRYRYLQQIPVPPSAALSFGDSVHKTLRDFYDQIKRGEKVSKESLLGFLEKNWSSVGYTSKAYEQRMRKRGEKILGDFYQSGFRPEVKVKTLEQVFKIKLAPSLTVGGKIDRIDEVGGGIEVYDYKTGQVWDQKRVDQSLQMTLYAMAVTNPQSSIFLQVDPQEVQLSFYFLDSGEKKTTQRDEKSLEKARKEILEKKELIEKSDFSPKAGPWCDFCDYKLICEAWS